MRSWRNRYTRTFEGRVQQWVRVQVPSTALSFLSDQGAFCFIYQTIQTRPLFTFHLKKARLHTPAVCQQQADRPDHIQPAFIHHALLLTDSPLNTIFKPTHVLTKLGKCRKIHVYQLSHCPFCDRMLFGSFCRQHIEREGHEA